MEEEKEYEGFWKKFGYALSIPAAIAIIVLVIGVGYLFYLMWTTWISFIG